MAGIPAHPPIYTAGNPRVTVLTPRATQPLILGPSQFRPIRVPACPTHNPFWTAYRWPQPGEVIPHTWIRMTLRRARSNISVEKQPCLPESESVSDVPGELERNMAVYLGICTHTHTPFICRKQSGSGDVCSSRWSSRAGSRMDELKNSLQSVMRLRLNGKCQSLFSSSVLSAVP